jgi:hypothetical protein
LYLICMGQLYTLSDCMFWHCVPTCPFIVSLKNLTAASISSSVLRETFKVNHSLMKCLKSSQFVCLLLKLGCFSCFSACAVSVLKTSECSEDRS